MRIPKVYYVAVCCGFAVCLLLVVAPNGPGQLQQELGKLPGAQFVADLVHQPLQVQALIQGQEQQPSGSDSVLGAPTITAAFINNVLAAAGSPAAGTGQSLYDLGVQYGIDPVYALAFFMHEDSFGKTGIGAANHSLGNIRCSAGYSCQDGFRSYATWEEGYRDWYSLISTGYVHGYITDAIVGHPCVTIEQIVPVYAPNSDGNDVTGYINAVLCAVCAWRAGTVYV